MFLFFPIFTSISFPDTSTLPQASEVTPRNTWKDQAVERDTTPKLLLSLTRLTSLLSSCRFNFCLGFLTTLNSLFGGEAATLFSLRSRAGRGVWMTAFPGVRADLCQDRWIEGDAIISSVHRSISPDSISPVDVLRFPSTTHASRQKLCREELKEGESCPMGDN